MLHVVLISKCALLYFISFPGLLLALGTVDAFLLHYAFNSVMAHGPSVQLVFGLEVSPSIVRLLDLCVMGCKTLNCMVFKILLY